MCFHQLSTIDTFSQLTATQARVSKGGRRMLDIRDGLRRLLQKDFTNRAVRIRIRQRRSCLCPLKLKCETAYCLQGLWSLGGGAVSRHRPSRPGQNHQDSFRLEVPSARLQKNLHLVSPPPRFAQKAQRTVPAKLFTPSRLLQLQSQCRNLP